MSLFLNLFMSLFFVWQNFGGNPPPPARLLYGHDTYIHAYIHTYIHTHMYTYIHMRVCTILSNYTVEGIDRF